MTDTPFSPSGGAPRAPLTTTYSAPSISSVPRRSSYASVLSGTAALSPPTSTPFSHLNSTSSYPPPFHPEARPSRHSAAVDADMQMNPAWRSSPGDSLPPYSRKFASFAGYDPYYQNLGGFSDTASSFTPSYLRNSRYIARLDAARRAKPASQRDAASVSSVQGSLPRIAPSYRGMTYDIIDREPVGDDDQPMPLPSRWSDAERYTALELPNEGWEVRYTGPASKQDHEAAAVRADHPMPPQCGIYYFEITIHSKPKEGMIGIGFSSSKASVERLPGWEQESWAYHGDDGKAFFGESQGQGRQYGPTFGVADTVGCGVNFSTGCAFFTKNGVFLGNAFRELRNFKVYPSVGMKRQPPVHLSANFGQQPFMFDIDGMVKKEKATIHSEISRTSIANIQPPLDETTFLQELVAQFLAHDGYVETARAFAEEVAAESAALENGRQAQLNKYEVEEDVEAINRQKIRAAILEGDIDKALKYTNAYYANVLEQLPHIHFKLRCRKFLEMMRRCTELSSSARKGKATNGFSDSAVFDEEMELDEQVQDRDGWEADGMDMEESETTSKSNQLLTEAVQYGQQLRIDYPNDENGGDKKMLDDIFSLVAYPDPKGSVHGHYLDPAGRVAVAEELNSAILVSLGKSSAAALERLYQQTEVLVNEISEEGGAGAFINLEGHIPTHSSSTSRADLHCCCGRKDCAFLQNNHDALEGLEKDLETAARLGQALLHRHESYMAEAEEDRQKFLASIETLEREKRQVQAENARIVEENRSLLEQLDGLNQAVADSDSHVQTLTAALENSEAELRHLTVSAARAADLEAQLAHMEAEQSKLQESLLVAQEDSKSAVNRWKKAECTLRDLNDQVDRIEKEAREERERHSELVQRMEKRRTVERELDGAAVRLKGAAAAQNLRQNGGPSVVSRFVKDILQDNANLQMGIVELREMLESSNQEVQNLRDQILSHQPLSTADGDRPATTLSQELEANESRRVSQEFHIHHHYHTPPVAAAKKEKSTLFRRSKKRRSLGNPPLHSASNPPTSRKAKHRSQPSMSSASTILSQTSVSIPPPSSQRWSLQSPVPPDSMASSPQSAYRSSISIFDRVERGFDTSQPTSPDSAVFTSPLRGGRYKNGGPFDAYRTSDGNDGGPLSDDELSELHLQSVIPEEIEDAASVSRTQSPGVDDDIFSTSTPYRTIHRAASHESLFSVAGMDIHTPSHRPSRMSGFTSGTLPIQVQRRIMSSELSSTPPVTSTTNVTAGREPSKPSHQSPQSILASVAGPREPQADTPPPTSMDDSALHTPTRIFSLGSRVGGWVRGRWGTAAVSSGGLNPLAEEPSPAQSCASSTISAEQTPSLASSAATPQKRPPLRFRYPGINQKGPIMGFRPPPPPPVSIHAEQLDEESLRESLA
ncbi:hypothetical protein BJY04DRAFT_209332 [Aspergillus karnatakaensis]|uniref:putative Ran-binding protein (RanBP10) n=1 Tax=Aspergillus karnatakaensis TaxID=1810916 RepID=UPI003CCC905C